MAAEWPSIEELMSPIVQVGRDTYTVSAARRCLEIGRFHHLPFSSEDGSLRIVSERDLRGIPGETLLKDLTCREPFCVERATTLQEVLTVLFERDIGSVLVREDECLIGIFTRRDACRYFRDFLLASSSTFVQTVEI